MGACCRPDLRNVVLSILAPPPDQEPQVEYFVAGVEIKLQPKPKYHGLSDISKAARKHGAHANMRDFTDP